MAVSHSLIGAAIDYQELRNHIIDAALALYLPEDQAVGDAVARFADYVPPDRRSELEDVLWRAVFRYLNCVTDHAVELALLSVHRQRLNAQDRESGSHAD